MNKPVAKTPYRLRQWQDREEAIIEAAYELMAGQGYMAMSVEDVLNAVGISRPTFYAHFDSKEALGVAVLLGMMQRAQVTLRELAQDKSPDEAVRAQMDWLLETNFDTRNKFENGRAMVLFNHERVQEGLREVEKLLAGSFERAQKAGAIREDVSAATLARTLLGVLRDPLNEVDCRSGALKLDHLKAELRKLLLGR